MVKLVKTMQYKLKEVHPKIFLLTTKDAYNLAMHFCRVQEYYENPVWRKKIFTMFEFMEWYAKEKGEGAFTYPNDWGGFNIPSKTLRDLYSGSKIPDENKYDEEMQSIIMTIEDEGYKGKQFYLIGSLESEKGTIKHEIAHGLWATDRKYKKKMQECIDNLTKEQYDCLKQWLFDHMYCKEVVDDEIQAYLSTGLAEDMNASLRRARIPYRTMRKPFAKVFKEFYNG